MIKLGKLTDYAVAVMVQLAKEGGTASRSAHQLAERTAIPEPTVAKVLKKLSRHKLVESERGVAGGYRLSRAAEELSVCDVIEALDGPIAIVSCATSGSETCRAEPKCPAKGKWSPVNQAIRTALQAVRLSDMARTSSCGHHTLMQISGSAGHVDFK